MSAMSEIDAERDEIIRDGALWFIHGADDVSAEDIARLRVALGLPADEDEPA